LASEKTLKIKVTLRQVAEQANVSISTVSFVLNNKGNISVSTRERVLQAVSHLNYKPRASMPKSDLLNKLLFVKIAKHGDTVNNDHNHFISDYIDGMSGEASRHNYSLEVISHHGTDMTCLLRSLENRDLSGAIILGTELSEHDITALSQLQKPMVLIDTFHPFLNASFVDMDNDQAIFVVLEHLKSLGFQRIGFVGSSSDVMNFRLREEAFIRACGKLKISVANEDRMTVSAIRNKAYEESKQYLETLDSYAEAYFCANDIIAFGVIKALQEIGQRVPEDVSVIGFDNLPASRMLSPTLTTINVPKQQIGAMAIRLLNDIIIADEPQPPVKVLVTGNLVSRDSTLKHHLQR
jgi:LacI family transcriptional regulator